MLTDFIEQITHRRLAHIQIIGCMGDVLKFVDIIKDAEQFTVKFKHRNTFPSIF